MPVLILALILLLSVSARADDSPLQTALLGGTYNLAGRDYSLVKGRYNRAGETGIASVLKDWVRTGDLNGDGTPDAAAPLTVSAGISDVVHYVVAVLDQGNGNYSYAASYLGDKMELQAVEIDGGTLMVDLKFHAKGDHLCCPTLEAKRAYVINGSHLVCQSSSSLQDDPLVTFEGFTPYGLRSRWVEIGQPWLKNTPPALSGFPEHVRITFASGTPGVINPREPQLRVLPIAAWEAFLEPADKKALRDQLGQIRNAATAKTIKPGKQLPLLPAVKEARRAQAQLQPLEFASGAGVRFITLLPAPAGGTAGAELVYVFEGLTSDGRYLVLGLLPLRAAPEAAAAMAASSTPEVELGQLDVETLSPKPAELDHWLSQMEIKDP